MFTLHCRFGQISHVAVSNTFQSHHASKPFECWCRQCLGKGVGDQLITGDVLEGDRSIQDELTLEVESFVDVFGSVMELGVICEINCALVVCTHQCCLVGVPDVVQ